MSDHSQRRQERRRNKRNLLKEKKKKIKIENRIRDSLLHEGVELPMQAILLSSGVKNYLVMENCLYQILEFANKFSYEIYQVVVKEGTSQILSIEDFCDAVNNPYYSFKADITIGKKIHPTANNINEIHITTPKTVAREDPRLLNQRIRNHIAAQVTSGMIVSVSNLADEYPNTSRSNICHQFSRVRVQLEEQGLPIERVAVGAYRLRRARRSDSPFTIGSAAWTEFRRRSPNA